MNTNNNFTNNVSHRNVVPSKKGKLAFIIILFIILLIIIVLIIKTTLNKQKMGNKLIKNTFFTEMNFNVKPYKAWCLIKNPDNTDDTKPIPYMINYKSNKYYYSSNNSNFKDGILYVDDSCDSGTCKSIEWNYTTDRYYEEKNEIFPHIPGSEILQFPKHCRPICIGGKKYKNGIPPNITHIKGSHSLMFWFKIKKELFDPSNESLSLDYPLVYFSNSNITPNYNLKKSLGFFITPINNTMKFLIDGTNISTIYNLPYDKWVCVTSVVNNKTIDIYINGRLLKTSITPLSNYNNLHLKWGPFPGDLAFVEVNNDLDELNAQSVYKNFKYYYGIIDKYKNHSDKKILLNTPFFKSPFKPLTHWDMLKGNTGNRTYNNVCY